VSPSSTVKKSTWLHFEVPHTTHTRRQRENFATRVWEHVLPDLLLGEPGSEHVLWAATCEVGTRRLSVVSCGPRSRGPGIAGGLGRSGMVDGGGGDGDGDDDGDSDGGRMSWRMRRRWRRRWWWAKKDSAVVPAQC
jgi:hypothetical protein